MPVVRGHAKLTLCRAASAARSSFMVTSLPLGTCFMRQSTSIGAGTTIVPSPQRVMPPVAFAIFGKPWLSVSFCCHDFFGFIISHRPTPPPHSSEVRDHFDFHSRALGQSRHLDG